jgi:uncharacterized membrane protein YccC
LAVTFSLWILTVMVLLRVLLVILLQIRHPLWALVTIAFIAEA